MRKPMTAVFGNLQTKNPPALADEVNAGGFCMPQGAAKCKNQERNHPQAMPLSTKAVAFQVVLF
jgi:hypothetical protein